MKCEYCKQFKRGIDKNCQVVFNCGDKQYDFLSDMIDDCSLLKEEPDLCGTCKHRDDKWSECEVYHMHVDSDELRNCKDFEDVKE